MMGDHLGGLANGLALFLLNFAHQPLMVGQQDICAFDLC